VDLDLITVELDRPRVCAHQAVDDVHERGLAGAVFAEQGVDLAPPDVQVYAVVGPQLTEDLDDPGESESL
jgi:hypothetical protein